MGLGCWMGLGEEWWIGLGAGAGWWWMVVGEGEGEGLLDGGGGGGLDGVGGGVFGRGWRRGVHQVKGEVHRMR